MGYCMLSAAPVGRYLLDLHGADVALYSPSDALCCALQVINHVQDCAEDHALLDRVYLPMDWMESEGANPEMLRERAATPPLRKVMDRMLTGTEVLLCEARPLANGLRRQSSRKPSHARRLGLEVAVIQQIAVALTKKLQRHDPVSRRVALSKAAYVSCGVKGVFREILGG